MTYRVRLLSLLIGLLVQNSCSPLYVTTAGYHQARLLLAREDTEDIFEDARTDPPFKARIELTNSLIHFAQEIGLDTNNNYKTYSTYQFPHMWVVTAAPEFSLNPYTWWFPIVGEVPYKGFFEEDDAKKEVDSLKTKNLDTSIRTASAYSSLGWFDDPITESLRSLSEHEYIITILHELLHVNVWIKGQVSFNETLANAFSYLAAIEYCERKSLPCAYDMKLYLEKQLQLTNQLESCFQELTHIFEGKYTDEIKREEKKKVYARLSDVMRNKKESFNNADFISLYVYYKHFDKIVNFLKKQGSIEHALSAIKRISQKQEDLIIAIAQDSLLD